MFFMTLPGGPRFLATKVVLDSAIMGSIYVIGEGTAQRNGKQARGCVRPVCLHIMETNG